MSTTHLDEKIRAAAMFLNEVSQKGYDEMDIRKYLEQTRGLSIVEIDSAFRVHRLEMARRPKLFGKIKKIKDLPPIVAPEKTCRVQAFKSVSGTWESPRGTVRSRENLKRAMKVLVDSRQVDGDRLLNDLLRTEKSYYVILECLENYHIHLRDLAGKRKIRMTRNEIEEIFCRIPYLMTFHRTFNEKLQSTSNIGKFFLRYYNGFKLYIEFMKDCKRSVDIIRRHILDDKLHKQLAHVRQISRFKKDNMFDLLLAPLDRIVEYKTFLNKLQEWADKKQTIKFSILAKATRRVGRVSHHIERYKEAIVNSSEMNKVQWFLKSQCAIFSPNRVIIRRGAMLGRTTGWTARNKSNIFFLFNDILLWTSKNGELQNIWPLENCEVKDSNSKNNFERKFVIILSGQKHKTLLLECTSKKQRNNWYEIIKRTIAGATGAIYEPPETAPHSNEHEWTKELVENVHEFIGPGARVQSKNSGGNKRRIIGVVDRFDAYGEIARCESFNYAESCTFEDQKLTDIDEFDDSLSQSSEHESDDNHLEGQDPSSSHSSSCGKTSVESVESKYAWERQAKDSYSEDFAEKQIPMRGGKIPAKKSVPSGKKRDAWKTQERKEDYPHEDKPKAGLVIKRNKSAAEGQRAANPNNKVCLNDL